MAHGPDAGHRRRRDRPLVRRAVRPVRHVAGGQLDRDRAAGVCRHRAGVRRGHRWSGCSTAFFTTVVKIPSFIVTLGSQQPDLRLHAVPRPNTQTFNPAYPPTGHETCDPSELAFFTGLPTRTCRSASRCRGSGCSDRRSSSASCCTARCSASGSRRSAAIRRPRGSPACRCAATSSWPSSCAALMACLAGDARLLLHRLGQPERRPVAAVPGVRGGDHRRRQPVRRQGHDHRHASRARCCWPILTNGLALSLGPARSPSRSCWARSPSARWCSTRLRAASHDDRGGGADAPIRRLEPPVLADDRACRDRRASAACASATATPSRWPASTSMPRPARSWASPARTAPARARGQDPRRRDRRG